MSNKNKISKSMLFYLIISSILIVIAVQLIIIILTFVFLHYFSVGIRDTFKTVYYVHGTSLILIIFVSIVFMCAFGFSYLIFKLQMKPINKIKNGLINLTKGKFNTRLLNESKTPRELGEMIDCFNILSEDLQKKEIFSNDFIHNFSHEFKTPIVSIRGFAKILRDDNTLSETEKYDYLNIIVTESQRLSKLSENILLLNKLENISILNEREMVNLAELTRQCILIQEKNIEEKDLVLDIDLQELKVDCNSQFIMQAILNILDNAIKFAPKKSIVSIYLKDYKLSVINDGHIDSKALDKIFEKFYQVDTNHSLKGNGIGLSLVKKIMELHKGNVSVENQGEKKVIFSLIFPKV
jgi:signal transduction histidine kinase